MQRHWGFKVGVEVFRHPPNYFHSTKKTTRAVTGPVGSPLRAWSLKILDYEDLPQLLAATS